MIKTYSESYKPTSFKHRITWNLGNLFGVTFIRIRSSKNRYGITSGNTFSSIHAGKYSFYKELTSPYKKLWFKKFVKLGETNHTMKILEVTS